jgi:hypothetical protein
MDNSSKDFQPLLDQFRSDNPYIALEKIKSLVEEAEKPNFLYDLFLIILLPRALILSWRIKSIIKSRKDLDSFSVLIEQDQLLIILSTLSYVAMWWHFCPIIWHFYLGLFLKGLMFSLLHYFFSKWALQSFKLTPTFEARYQALKSFAQARYQVISNAPEMMQNLINQSFTAMISSGALDEETARTVAKIMQNAYREVLGSFNDKLESEVDDDEFLSHEFLSLEKEEDK